VSNAPRLEKPFAADGNEALEVSLYERPGYRDRARVLLRQLALLLRLPVRARWPGECTWCGWRALRRTSWPAGRWICHRARIERTAASLEQPLAPALHRPYRL